MTDPDPRNRSRASGFVLPTAGTAAVAAIIAGVFVLPAEYGIDPTGLGAALGLTRISAPQEIAVETRFTAPPEIATLREQTFRTETIEIEVNPFSVDYGQLEYKVSMNEGDLLLYSWTSDRPLIFEFHGHTVDDRTGDPIEVMDYIAGEGTSANGTLVAPIDGIHGWYFANSAFDDPAHVQITLSGYFELEPGIIELER
ncbi:MAG: hypothetical protein CMJ15_05795 [Pelagibacterium sp.]|uniref:hypothetical protein n=1 Tax=uncultured Pelagibacterium sp. TaxID=1159875 RepID=UPI000C4A05E9|nr:hypothetical protein [Pelagibacterium sp.]|tara:strand:+ start:1079 stop:1675 length:597 start_codon:yes stop_codon:yes gene_type:complete